LDKPSPSAYFARCISGSIAAFFHPITQRPCKDFRRRRSLGVGTDYGSADNWQVFYVEEDCHQLASRAPAASGGKECGLACSRRSGDRETQTIRWRHKLKQNKSSGSTKPQREAATRWGFSFSNCFYLQRL
jgi:hypothetical protein